MFANIGRKLKMVAIVWTIIGIVVSIVEGLIISIQGASYGIPLLVLAGILVILVGSLFSWLSSFLLYGFGELVDNSNKLVKISRGMSNEVAEQEKDETQKKLAALERLRDNGIISEEEYDARLMQYGGEHA